MPGESLDDRAQCAIAAALRARIQLGLILDSAAECSMSDADNLDSQNATIT
jgi:hypothetical protein